MQIEFQPFLRFSLDLTGETHGIHQTLLIVFFGNGITNYTIQTNVVFLPYGC